MADLKTRITDEVKTAMRAGEKQRLAALRLIQAEIKQKEVDDRVDLNDPQGLQYSIRWPHNAGIQ